MSDGNFDKLNVNNEAYFAGNVGIGIARPGRVLEVCARDSNTGIRITGTDSDRSWLIAVGAEAGDGKFCIYDYGGRKHLHVHGHDINGLFEPGGQRLTIDTDGNVGIGTTSPSAKLEVNGDIKVTGDVLLSGADCAEDFNIAAVEGVEAGTVMVICQDGALQPSQKPYDKRVAGVISGAGDLRPGIVLDKQAHDTGKQRSPLALVGKVFCKVDASYASIEVGDLLTSSPTPGHGMKADDHAKSFGSVFGKALRGLESGQGLIPILVCLQ